MWNIVPFDGGMSVMGVCCTRQLAKETESVQNCPNAKSAWHAIVEVYDGQDLQVFPRVRLLEPPLGLAQAQVQVLLPELKLEAKLQELRQ